MDARAQAARYIKYYHSIPLTPAQEAVKNEALAGIPAPCCKEFSMATCCCPCNLAKAVWGFAGHLIAAKSYGASQVRSEVERWLASANPNGAAGDACRRDRCNRPFHEDGCGGMQEDRIS